MLPSFTHLYAFTPVIVVIQALGYLSAWAARCSEGSRHQAWFQRLFVVSLLLVGGATIVSLGVGPGCWVSCGTTLSLMVVGATCEFTRSDDAQSLQET